VDSDHVIQHLLSPTGCFYLVAVSQNKPEDIMQQMDDKHGLKSKVTASLIVSRTRVLNNPRLFSADVRVVNICISFASRSMGRNVQIPFHCTRDQHTCNV
jgi:hypothetical protein